MSTLAVNTITPQTGTTTTLNTDTVIPTGKKVTYTDKGSILQPHSILQTGSYNTGYGSGARTSSTSTSWFTIALNGTGQLARNCSQSGSVLTIPKINNSSHIEVTVTFPTYIYGSGASGSGIRCKAYSADSSINSGNAFLMDLLPNGPADYWGWTGYPTDTGLADVSTLTWRTDYNSNYASALKSYTGDLKIYWEARLSSSSDQLWIIDYGDANPKYGFIQWIEVYEP